ncbi:hypothetical protein [Paraburkholderia aromaticivorans]
MRRLSRELRRLDNIPMGMGFDGLVVSVRLIAANGESKSPT